MSKQQQSHISPEAKISEDVQIGPFCYIEKDVEIGKGTWIGPNVSIFRNTKIGSNCKVFPGAVLGAIPQDLKFEGEETFLEIGNNVTIRECCTLNRGTKASWRTVVESNCLLMAYTHIAHDCIVRKGAILANNVNLAGHVEIGEYAYLAGLVAVQQFIRVGSNSMIAGAGLVRKDVPPFVRAANEPLSFIGVNVIGLQRKGFSDNDIQYIKSIYQLVYSGNYLMNEKLDRIQQEFAGVESARVIIDFVKTSVEGIIRNYH